MPPPEEDDAKDIPPSRKTQAEIEAKIKVKQTETEVEPMPRSPREAAIFLPGAFRRLPTCGILRGKRFMVHDFHPRR